MTNRDYINTFTDEKLSFFIYEYIVKKIGKAYTVTIEGVANWFGKEYNKDEWIWKDWGEQRTYI